MYGADGKKKNNTKSIQRIHTHTHSPISSLRRTRKHCNSWKCFVITIVIVIITVRKRGRKFGKGKEKKLRFIV